MLFCSRTRSRPEFESNCQIHFFPAAQYSPRITAWTCPLFWIYDFCAT